MSRLAVVPVVLAVAVAAGCNTIEPSGAAPTDAPTSGTRATAPETTDIAVAPEFDPAVTVPQLDGARLGCVDEPGSIQAPAAKWYASGAPGALAFTGEFVTTSSFIDFTNAVDDAVSTQLQSFVAEGASELSGGSDSCVTYRYVQFLGNGDASIIVAVWRVEGATDPFWVPNERDFVVLDNATLASDGDHIRVALVVAPDGTTVRVSAYGANAVDLVAGWPSTITVTSNLLPGPAPATVQQLISIGRDVLRYSLDR